MAAIDNYSILGELGWGTTSRVFLALEENEQEKHVAIKMVNYKTPGREEDKINLIKTESVVLSKLSHQHVIKFICLKEAGEATLRGYKVDRKKHVYSVFQIGENGTFLKHLKDGGAFSELVAKSYFKQLVDGLVYIHGCGFVHRDLKPENLLLGSDFQLLIADFGCAASIYGSAGNGFLEREPAGTTCYNAPEMKQDKYRGPPVDVFMAGVVLFIFLTGRPPFYFANRKDEYYSHIRAKNSAAFWTAHQQVETLKLSQDVKDLIVWMLSKDPADRPSLRQVLTHSWLSGLSITLKAKARDEMMLRSLKIIGNVSVHSS